jgi:multidrug efflux system membrane fusion protein
VAILTVGGGPARGGGGRILARPGAVRGLTVWLACVVLLCVPGACGDGAGGKPPPPEGRAVTAQVETLALTSLPVYAVYPGTVVSEDRVDISSRLTGYLHALDVHEGQTVSKDQLLLTVDPTGVQAQIRRAQAELAAAEATLKNARANYNRYRNLYQQQATTLEEYQQMETAYQVATGGYEAARAALADARTQIKYAEVRAPFDGLIVAKLADNGQLATPGTPLLVMEDPNHLQVRTSVDEQSFAHLRIGQPIRIELTGPDHLQRSVTGAVERLVASSDPVTHTHLVKIGLPADSEASSGEYALVHVPVGAQEGIVVPAGAVRVRAGITGVFVVDEGGRARFRMVRAGERVPQGRVVLSGLFPGDRVVLSSDEPLANGRPVRVRAEDGA